MEGTGGKVREAGRALREVFANPGLRKLNLALVGSVIGDWAYAVAVSVYAYQQGGATVVGVLGVIRYVLMALVLPFTSSLADRFRRKRVMISADLIRGVLVLAAAAIIAADGPALPVYALGMLTAVVGTAFRPAQAALIPRLARSPGELTASNVAASTIESAGFFLGPAIAGLLLVVASIPLVYVFDALTFAWSAVLVLGVHEAARGAEEDESEEHATAADPPDSGGREALAGYRYIGRHGDLRLIMGLYCAQTVIAGASLVFEVAIALDLLELKESGVGLLDSVLGVGGLVGGFLALVLAQRSNLASDFGFAVLGWAAPLLLIVLWPSLAATLVAMAILGLSNAIVDINASTILQRIVPDQVMGRVFGAMDSLLIGGMAVGALLMPILISTVGLRAGLGVIGAAVSLAVLLALPQLRRIDHRALAPAGLELVRGVPIFSPLAEPVLERLARTAEHVQVPAGIQVFLQGDEGDRFYIVESGTAAVSIDGTHIRDLGPGGSFGEIALLKDVPRTATVIATTDLALLGIEREEFLSAVTGSGEAREAADLVMTRLLSPA